MATVRSLIKSGWWGRGSAMKSGWWGRWWAAAIILTIAAFSQAAQADTCTAADNGRGTVDLPANCSFATGPEDSMVIREGLAPGTEISIDAILGDFSNVIVRPGGRLGGEILSFKAMLTLNMSGEGTLPGFSRTVSMLVLCEVHTAPRVPGNPVQTFDTELFRLSGSIAGDPDFGQLSVSVGAGLGLPGSTGRTTLTRLGPPGSDFNADSFFDITYRIHFTGAAGSILEGLSGTTTETSRIVQGEATPLSPCEAADNGIGTVNLPVPCDYVSRSGPMVVTEGLGGTATFEVLPRLTGHTNVVRVGGGKLCGEIESFDSTLVLNITGTGDLAGFNRTISAPVGVVIHTGPRNPGDAVQVFQTEIVSMELKSQVFSDPDFDVLRVRAGRKFGLPSPGHTTLTKLTGGDFAVDSFFDITYQIDFTGAPGGALDGLSGTSQGQARIGNGRQPAHDTFFGLANRALGDAQLAPSSSGGGMVVSNIGSSGEDGVVIDPGLGAGGFSFEANFGEAGALPAGGTFAIDSFFDITYQIDFQNDGRGALSISPRGCNPEAVFVQLLLDGEVVDSKGFAETLPDDLVVGNIGSSGQDGVRIDLGSREGDDVFFAESFFDVFTEVSVGSFFDVFFDITVSDVGETQISGNGAVTADTIRLISRACKCPCGSRGGLVTVRGANIESIGIADQAIGLFDRRHR